MPAIVRPSTAAQTKIVACTKIKPNAFSTAIYGDPALEIDDLLPSVREHGILVPIVIAGQTETDFEVISGHRRLACARLLGIDSVPCELRDFPDRASRCRAVLEYNRQRRKTFSQLMREADAIEELVTADASRRRQANLTQMRRTVTGSISFTDRRNSDVRDATSQATICTEKKGLSNLPKSGRTDAFIAQHLELGGKDLYRQARMIWRLAQEGDIRAQSGRAQLDSGTKTIYAVYKDLRRRDRFTTDFRPTPYDVWSFRHDRAFGIPHPGSIPPGIIAHALHYFSPPNGLVVDPMAGGGTTVDVCKSMGRRCLAYDLHPSRPDIEQHDIRRGFPPQGAGADLIFCDPPYHTMLAQKYAKDTVATAPLSEWIAFLHQLTRDAYESLKPGAYLALLLAPQTEKDIPRGYGYLDHAFFGYTAALRAGFCPERRISCPMDGAYLPQHIRRARLEGRLLGQVRDLLVMRKPQQSREHDPEAGLGIPGY